MVERFVYRVAHLTSYYNATLICSLTGLRKFRFVAIMDSHSPQRIILQLLNFRCIVNHVYITNSFINESRGGESC